MYNLENRREKEHKIQYSRYVISWLKSGGSVTDYFRFKEWLKSEGLKDREIDEIGQMFTFGKLELEKSAERFLKLKGH